MPTIRKSALISAAITIPLVTRHCILDNTDNYLRFFGPDGFENRGLSFALPSLYSDYRAAFLHDGLIRLVTPNRLVSVDFSGVVQSTFGLPDGGIWEGGTEYGGNYWLIDSHVGGFRVFNPAGTEQTSLGFTFTNFVGEGAFRLGNVICGIDNLTDQIKGFNVSGVEQFSIDVGTGNWFAGFGIDGIVFGVDDGANRVVAWDQSGVVQAGMGYNLADKAWTGSFAYEGEAIAPVWSTVPAQTVFHTTSVDIDLHDYLTGDSPFMFTVSGLPTGLSHSDGVISGTTTADGTHTVSVTVSNVAGEASTTFDMGVSGGVTAPVWSTIPNLVIDYNGSINFNLHNYVTGGGTITITASGLPTGVSINNGVLTGSGITSSGTHTVTVTATNAGGSTSTTFSITVLSEPDMESGGWSSTSTTANVGDTVSFTVTYTYREGQSFASGSSSLISGTAGGLTLTAIGMSDGFSWVVSGIILSTAPSTIQWSVTLGLSDGTTENRTITITVQ